MHSLGINQEDFSSFFFPSFKIIIEGGRNIWLHVLYIEHGILGCRWLIELKAGPKLVASACQ